MQKVIREIFLDQVALVTEADDKIIEAVMAVDFHDVPKNRPTANFDHRLRANRRFLGKACAQAAC